MTDDEKQYIEIPKSRKFVFKQLLSRKSHTKSKSTPNDDVSEKVNSNTDPLFVGMYDYSSRTDNDLSFKKGDLLYIISTDEDDDDVDDDWWYARSKHTGQEGYIPSNHVVEFESQLDTEV